ncbi:MAG: hypothetical protein BGO67_07325 [Alphaproteobacteria bacterium 41-28]|nr:MAG: hypothetical protein BGO67_07325 [Alphaproteobacteria bacterium 41-28]
MNFRLPIIPLLASNEVHIWSACLSKNQVNIPRFQSLLSADESQKANSFRFLKDKHAFIVSRGILRCLLGGYLRKDPQHIEILYGLWGKPCLSQEYSLYFNLSHSKEYTLYAFASSYELGIDLEYIDSTLDVAKIAPTILSSQERAFWEEVPPKDKTYVFFKLWVYKEALLKASGKGWLSNEQEIPLSILKSILKVTENGLEKEKRGSPYYFEVIPGYASGLHVEGPYFYPLHYVWNSDGSQLRRAPL